jgi:PGF-CTERM protein
LTEQFDAAGTYDLRVVVTSSAGVGEENLTVTVGSQEPDIVVTSLSLNQTDLTTGESVLVEAEVRNDGAAAGTGSVGLTVFGEQVTAEEVSLEPGETTTVTFVQRFDAVGEYDVIVGDQSQTVTVGTASGGTGGGDPGEETTTTTPGFGLAVAVLALLGAALLATRRR